MAVIKRLNYFHHQLLNEKDFRDEQAYHIDMRRRHNRAFFSWGLVNGLKVEKVAKQRVVVHPGMAIDAEGREVVLLDPYTVELSEYAAGSKLYIAVRFSEHKTVEEDYSDAEGETRIAESPVVDVRMGRAPDDGSVIVIARVDLDSERNIQEIDVSECVYASPSLPPGSVAADTIENGAVWTSKLADRAVTEDKLSDDVRAKIGRNRGWTRLVFQPLPVERVRVIMAQTAHNVDTVSDYDTPFISGSSYARSGQKGARGTMTIPVPPAVDHIKGFRIAGWTNARVEVQLTRIDWSTEEGGKETDIINRTFEPSSNGLFDHIVRIDQQRLSDSSALSVDVRAHGQSRIWLIAAEF